MQDVVQRRILNFLYAIARDTEVTVLYQVGHDLLLDGTVVFLCIDTEDDLLLQVHQFLTDGLVF